MKKLLTPDSERDAVGYLQKEYSCSQRGACRILLVNRATARHKRIKDKDQALRARMHRLAEKRKRFGAPRLHVLLKQEGLVINHKRTERIYREEGLALRKSKPKKEIAKALKPAAIVGGPEEC